MKKKTILAIAIFVMGLMITSTISITADENENFNINVKVSNLEKQTLEMQKKPVEYEKKFISKPLGNPEFAFEGFGSVTVKSPLLSFLVASFMVIKGFVKALDKKKMKIRTENTINSDATNICLFNWEISFCTSAVFLNI